jgi:hypothetical protein
MYIDVRKVRARVFSDDGAAHGDTGLIHAVLEKRAEFRQVAQDRILHEMAKRDFEHIIINTDWTELFNTELNVTLFYQRFSPCECCNMRLL